jgi:hypothetical protein
MYEFNGHVRHFFSEEYVRICLNEAFKISTLWTGNERLYNKESSIVNVIARAIK